MSTATFSCADVLVRAGPVGRLAWQSSTAVALCTYLPVS
jgi:hypothetical protein